MADIVFSVSQVNEYISRKMFSDPLLSRIKVSGEITNLVYSSVGHAFFSLKDENSMLGCILYDYANHQDKDALYDGASAEISGRLSFYRKSAAVQLVMESAAPLGIGNLYARFERTRQKLSDEGLFLESRKKPLPYFAVNIGVVTSPSGAVLHDIINVATRRFDGVCIIVYPVQVQGPDAAPDICRGISYFNEHTQADVIIVARGGGSFEDLSAFNEESVVRAVYNSAIPVVSAVGHETDYTLCDMAADLRAPTPSAAAELVVKEKSVLIKIIDEYKQKLYGGLETVIESSRQRLDMYKSALSVYPLNARLSYAKAQLKLATEQISSAITAVIKRSEMRLEQYRALLYSLDPRSILSRGYTIVYDKKGQVIKSANAAVGDIEIEFSDGRAAATGRGR